MIYGLYTLLEQVSAFNIIGSLALAKLALNVV